MALKKGYKQLVEEARGCQSAGRATLATAVLQDMGLPRVAHIEGGCRAWKDSGAPTAAKEPHRH